MVESAERYRPTAVDQPACTLDSCVTGAAPQHVLTAHLGLGVQLMAAGGEDGGERGSAAAAASREPSSASMSPEQAYGLLALLGDLTPREWPPLGHAAGSGFPPPTSQGRRNAFARAIEAVSTQFSRVLAFGLTAECRMARCAAVRLVARAAGLGGGMATSLVLPLVEALGGAVRGVGSPAAGGVVPGPPPLPADARRLLEALVTGLGAPAAEWLRGLARGRWAGGSVMVHGIRVIYIQASWP